MTLEIEGTITYFGRPSDTGLKKTDIRTTNEKKESHSYSLLYGTKSRTCGLRCFQFAPFIDSKIKTKQGTRIIKAYVNDTAGNKSNSGVPGEGLERFFEGVTGAFTVSLEQNFKM